MSKPKKFLAFLLPATFVVLITACNTLPGIQEFESIPVKQFPFPDVNYSTILTVNQELIGLTSGEDFDNQWWYAKTKEQNLNQIIFPQDPKCASGTAYSVYETLPDGRLQLWKFCGTETKSLTYLVAYEWQTGEMQELAGPLPLGSSQVSWNPDQTRGIVYLDSKFSSQTLYWIWRDGFGPLDLVITDQDKSWNLKNFFPDFPDSETLRSGNTGRAVWSPDGYTIAFFASPDAIGKTEFDRFYAEYNLYLMDADQLEPKAVLSSIYFPFIIKWSPDSKYIALIGQYGLLKQEGIWLYTVESNSIQNIAKGNFQDILWNADNKSLIAIHCDDNHYCSQIEEYDMTGLVNH